MFMGCCCAVINFSDIETEYQMSTNLAPDELPESVQRLIRRQTRETSNALAARIRFYQMHPTDRSIARLCKIFNDEAAQGMPVPTKSLGTMNQWANTQKWFSGAKAYDDAIAAHLALRHLQAIEDMNARHVRIAQKIQARIEQAIDTEELDVTQPRVAKEMLDLSIRTERQARGVPSHLISLMSESTDVLQARYQALAAAASGDESDDTDDDDDGFDADSDLPADDDDTFDEDA
jgi:hypothetical protein